MEHCCIIKRSSGKLLIDESTVALSSSNISWPESNKAIGDLDEEKIFYIKNGHAILGLACCLQNLVKVKSRSIKM